MKKMMMMLFMATVALTASAQNEVGQLTLQPKVGFNLANITDTRVKTSSYTDNTEKGNLKGDFVLGLEAEYGIEEKISVAAGLLYSRQGTDFGEVKVYGNPDGSVSEGWDKYEFNLGYLNIPVVANFYFAKGLAVKVGVQPGFLLSARKEIDGLGNTENESKDAKDLFKSFDLSIPFGLSYEYEKAVFDLRYNFGMTKINKDDGDYKNSVIQFTVGYKFNL